MMKNMHKKLLFLSISLALCIAWRGSASALQKILYNDSGILPGVPGVKVFTWDSFRSVWEVGFATATFNGSFPDGIPDDPLFCFHTESNNGNTYAGWGIFKSTSSPEDMSSYTGGDLKFWVKTERDLKVEIQEGVDTKHTKYITDYEWSTSDAGNWKEITIPLADFGADLSNITGLFIITIETSNQAFYIDNVRYDVEYSMPTKIRVAGRQLMVDDEPFMIKGVCYSPTPVGEGYREYDFSAHPEVYERDFRLIKAMGANTIRIYRPPTKVEFLDAAYDAGIYVIMDYPVPHDAVLSSATVRNSIKTAFISMVNAWKDHPAVLMWNLGNEINFHLKGLSPSEWYSFVNTCAGEAHTAEGAEYHPVISANAEIAEIGNAADGADDDSLPALGAWAVQIYRGSSFGDMFTELESRTSKPVIITEFGCDAFDMKNKQEEQAQQASYLQNQLSEIAGNTSAADASKICIGGTVFMWSDDWSKSQWGWPDSVHDTDGLYSNSAYYDWENGINNINEEWWGVCAVSPGTTDRTFRDAYYTLQSAWRGSPLMNVHINGGNALAWSSAAAGENKWKVADNPITIETDDAYNDNFDVWGIQIYTDNTSADAVPRYQGDTAKSFNLVGKTDASQGLALCWKITDAAEVGEEPVWLQDRGDAEQTEGFTDYQWRWMKDAGQTANAFVMNEEYVRVWDQNGIYWADRTALDVDPSKPGNQSCPAPASSPNYIYIAVRLHDAVAQKYSTNKLILDFLFP